MIQTSRLIIEIDGKVVSKVSHFTITALPAVDRVLADVYFHEGNRQKTCLVQYWSAATLRLVTYDNEKEDL